jgi:hypothetical protein
LAGGAPLHIWAAPRRRQRLLPGNKLELQVY